MAHRMPQLASKLHSEPKSALVLRANFCPQSSTATDTLIGMAKHTLSRRAILGAASVGVLKAATAATNIWSAEYTAHKGSVSLAMYRKRVGSPASGQPPLPVLFLVHGSSLSARTSY